MDMMLFILGFLGLLVLIVLFIKNIITKKPKKKIGAGMLICLILMVIGLAMPKTDSSEKDSPATVLKTQPENVTKLVDGEPEIEPKIEPEPEVEVEVEVIKISAKDLYKAYKDNEIAADNKYKKQTLEVTGIVKNIGKDIFNNIYITLDVDEYFDSVQCFFKDSESESVAKLLKEQEITITGRCDGLTISSVIIKNSKIE